MSGKQTVQLPPEYLTTEQVAQQRGYSRSSVRRIIREGRLTAIKSVDGNWLISEASVLTLPHKPSPPAEGLRRCSTCQQDKEPDKYHHNAARAFGQHPGLDNICKECRAR